MTAIDDIMDGVRAAASNSMNGGTAMNSQPSSGMAADTKMDHSTKMKKKHTTAMTDTQASGSSDAMVSSNSKMPGTKATGGAN